MEILIEIIQSEWFIGAASMLIGRFVVPHLPIKFLNRIKRAADEVAQIIARLENLDKEAIRRESLESGLKDGAKILDKYLGDK